MKQSYKATKLHGYKTTKRHCYIVSLLHCHGFTLIELLVAMLIVGILMGLSLVGFGATRKSARDSKRKADLEQIRSALEIYRNDCKTYPATEAVVSGSSLTGAEISCSDNIYMSSIPSDPLATTYKYSYSRTDTNNYVLCASLEISSETVTGCGDCGSGITCNYKVTNP